MIIDLITLIPLAIIYILTFPLGALMCRYVSMKLLAALNVTLGILGILGFVIFEAAGGYFPDTANLLIVIPFYIYIPNLILYFKMRKKCKRNSERKKYTFKRNAGMAAVLTACHYPIVWLCIVALTVLY